MSTPAGLRQCATKCARDREQPLIARPEFGSPNDRGSQQVNIDVTDAFAMESAVLDVTKHLMGFCNYRHRQMLEQVQGQCAICQAAAGNLTHDKWMHDHGTGFKQIDELRISCAKIVDPY